MKMTLLIVDDSKTIRSAIIRILKNEPGISDIFEAENGAKALQILSTTNVDLILSDVVMPHLDGFGLIAILQKNKEWKEIPVVLLTSQADLDNRIRGLELGAWDYIIKPANPIELRTRIQVIVRIKTLQNSLKSRMYNTLSFFRR